jgi:hypothetical protein
VRDAQHARHRGFRAIAGELRGTNEHRVGSDRQRQRVSGAIEDRAAQRSDLLGFRMLSTRQSGQSLTVDEGELTQPQRDDDEDGGDHPAGGAEAHGTTSRCVHGNPTT